MSQSFTVTNRGGDSTFELSSDDVGWMFANPLSADIARGESVPVEVSISAAALAPGSYSDTIRIVASDCANPPVEVAVSLSVDASDGGLRDGGVRDGGAAMDGGTRDGGASGMCCCRYLAEHYCPNCTGCPQGLCLSGQCYSPCWECVTAAASMNGWLCGTSCNAASADRCDVACP